MNCEALKSIWTFQLLVKTRGSIWLNNLVRFGLQFHKDFLVPTDSTKINRPEHNIPMYWTNFWQPTAHVQQKMFGKTSMEACSPHLYASFDTFYAKIGQFLVAQWVFEVCLKIDN